MSNDIAVSFCLYTLDSHDCYTEEELAAGFDALKPALISSKPQQGSIIISNGAGEARITDELCPAIAGLCFESIGHLLENRVYVYSYFETHRYAVLIPVGEKLVHVVGDDIKSLDTDKEVLVRRLYACGLRYIQFLERLGEDPDHAASLEVLRQIAASVPVVVRYYR
jgi:hypothetical protein